MISLRAVAAVLLLIGGGGGLHPLPVGSGKPDAVVDMTNVLKFVPERVTIKTGQTIEWRNPSLVFHTVTADPARALNKENVALPQKAKPFHSGEINPGENYRRTFSLPGTYKYVCLPHEMVGMI